MIYILKFTHKTQITSNLIICVDFLLNLSAGSDQALIVSFGVPSKVFAQKSYNLTLLNQLSIK